MLNKSHRSALLIAIVSGAMISLSAPVSAAADAEAATALAKKNGCFKCHAIDKTKKGPALNKVAAKYKGKPDGEEKVIKFITTGAKIKLNGSEEEHKVIDTKDQKELKNLAQWILSQ